MPGSAGAVEVSCDSCYFPGFGDALPNLWLLPVSWAVITRYSTPAAERNILELDVDMLPL